MKGDSFLVFNKFSFKIIIFVLTVLGCLGEALLLDASLSNNLILMSSIFTVISDLISCDLLSTYNFLKEEAILLSYLENDQIQSEERLTKAFYKIP